jgi:anthranilate phosphoribosyltransferase
MLEAILRGEPGARRDVVLLNAGAALLVAGAVETLADGVDRAALTIDAGLAMELVEALRAERRAAEAALTTAGAAATEAAAEPPVQEAPA